MEENATQLVNHCSFAGIRPIMVDLPYPPIQAEQKNPVYANLLSIDYCGSVSEMSAITSTSIMKTGFPVKNVLWQKPSWESPWRR